MFQAANRPVVSIAPAYSPRIESQILIPVGDAHREEVLVRIPGRKRRSGVIVICDGKVALIRRERGKSLFYVLPGGRMEPGESAEETAIREAREELGLDVTLTRLAAVYAGRWGSHYYFMAQVMGGEFGTGNGPEFSPDRNPRLGTYTPVWVPLEELHAHKILPIRLVRAIAWHKLDERVAPVLVVDRPTPARR